MAEEKKKIGLFTRIFGRSNPNTGGDGFGGSRSPDFGGGSSTQQGRHAGRRTTPTKPSLPRRP